MFCSLKSLYANNFSFSPVFLFIVTETSGFNYSFKHRWNKRLGAYILFPQRVDTQKWLGPRAQMVIKVISLSLSPSLIFT